jgi:hypothetical protein
MKTRYGKYYIRTDKPAKLIDIYWSDTVALPFSLEQAKEIMERLSVSLESQGYRFPVTLSQYFYVLQSASMRGMDKTTWQVVPL